MADNEKEKLRSEEISNQNSIYTVQYEFWPKAQDVHDMTKTKLSSRSNKYLTRWRPKAQLPHMNQPFPTSLLSLSSLTLSIPRLVASPSASLRQPRARVSISPPTGFPSLPSSSLRAKARHGGSRRRPQEIPAGHGQRREALERYPSLSIASLSPSAFACAY